MTSSEWEQKLKQFCDRYNLEIEYLADVLNDPKVVPMIRGKSFEFTVKKYLSRILSNKYAVINPRLNDQTGLQDIDVAIINNETSKGSFRANYRGNPYLKVKCMRARTLGEEAAKQRAKATGISFNLLKIHNDKYTPDEFDFVVTSIANAFYKTDKDGLFYWSPPEEANFFLKKLAINSQQDAFQKMYVAKSKYLAANKNNKIACTRKKCQIENCNFLPNYPTIYFDLRTGKPMQPWLSLEDLETLLD